MSNYDKNGNLKVSIANEASIPVTGPLTDEQLRASPVEVTGTLIIDTDGLATEEKQDDMLTIQDQVQELISRLAFLASVRGISNDLRVTILNASIAITGSLTAVTTVTTVTTVSTVSNQTNIGGINATPLVPSNQNILTTLANINNVTG